MNQSSRCEYTRDQPACTTVQEKTWCRCASALNLRSCLKESTASKGPNQTRFRRTQSLCLILKERKTQYQNLLVSKVLLTKVCELIEKTPSLLGKVTQKSSYVPLVLLRDKSILVGAQYKKEESKNPKIQSPKIL